MKRGAPPKTVRQPRSRARRILLLLAAALLFVVLGPLYALWAVYLSGHLVLTQGVNAEAALRGFNFGPVYLEQGVAGRYFISAVLPASDSAYWQTSFEVLNDQLLPVYHQDELRFIGGVQFQAGQRDSYSRSFVLDQATGYYWFRFKAENGLYTANPQAKPVVQFTVRQGVITGPLLWGPAAGAILMGLLLLILAFRLIYSLGRPGAQDQAPQAASRRERALRAGRMGEAT